MTFLARPYIIGSLSTWIALPPSHWAPGFLLQRDKNDPSLCALQLLFLLPGGIFPR